MQDEIRTHPVCQVVIITVRRLLAGFLMGNKPERLVKASRTNLQNIGVNHCKASVNHEGNYARGEATENSDIDVAVELNGPMGLNFVAMADEIEDLFGIKVDVVPIRSIKPAYLPFVEKDMLYF